MRHPEVGARVFGAAWHERAVLGDGRRILLRLVQPDDGPLLAAGFAMLSPESVYRRFHVSRGPLTADELRSLTDLDGETHLAICALDSRTRRGLGVVRIVRLPSKPEVAEVAVTVVDSAQRKGLGRLLLLRIAAAARERGIASLRFYVLTSNSPMIGLLKSLSVAMETTRDGYVLQFDVPVAKLDLDVSSVRRGHRLHAIVSSVLHPERFWSSIFRAVHGSTVADGSLPARPHTRRFCGSRGSR